MAFTKTQHIKEALVKFDRKNQLIITLPSELLDETNPVAKRFHLSLDGFTEEDVVVKDIIERADDTYYKVTIAGCVDLDITESADDGTINYYQTKLHY